MKKIFTLALPFIMGLSVKAQDIKLPAPNLQRQTLSMMETLNTRHSVREYSSKELSMQDISDLCWAACGRTRDDEHRTAPTAMNRKEIRLYVFTKDAVYEYLPVENQLVFCAKGDHRDKVAGGAQKFVLDAPVSLVMVVDYKRFGQKNSHTELMGCVDAGIVSQNINLYCQAAGLATVPRATHDAKAISELLKLTEDQVVMMNNPVGYPK